jgi:hypothetical protein
MVDDGKKGDWCIISIDGIIMRTNIVHKSRGKYIIVDDIWNGKNILTG